MLNLQNQILLAISNNTIKIKKIINHCKFIKILRIKFLRLKSKL